MIPYPFSTLWKHVSIQQVLVYVVFHLLQSDICCSVDRQVSWPFPYVMNGIFAVATICTNLYTTVAQKCTGSFWSATQS